MKKFLYTLLAAAFLYSCSPKLAPLKENAGTPETTFTHPKWSEQSNIYEVNVRQYSKEGTFKAFEKSLPGLKEMGVKILWFMPITPIGLKDRKENESQLGSYYSVKDYRSINPEFGTMEDWKNLVAQAHTSGFKVIVDWVPNHTAADNPWITRHPDFYKKDEDGKIVIPFDWTDVRQLDYSNMEMRDSMIANMEFWVKSTGIDGFRCDHVDPIPVDFWNKCITDLRKIKDVFMLAESEDPKFHHAGFDATYAWNIMWATVDVAQQKHSLKYMDSVLNHNFSTFPKNAERMYFTTNHDENSWNGTEFEKYGDAYKAFAVFTQTMYQSIPLIYSGQEEPNKKRLKFFVKDPIQWGSYKMAPFYSTLLHLRSNNPALAADAAYKRIATGNNNAIFAYIRQKNNRKVGVILNLSAEPQSFTIDDKLFYGKTANVFSGTKDLMNRTHVFTMKPWDYLIFEYR